MAVACYDCPAGHYCAISGESTICPAGYYCPAGTALDWQACPSGTYSDQQGLYEESQCQPCTGGKYCGGAHLTQPTGKLLIQCNLQNMFSKLAELKLQ